MIDHDNLEEFRDPQTYLNTYDARQLAEEPLTATSPCMIYVCQRRV